MRGFLAALLLMVLVLACGREPREAPPAKPAGGNATAEPGKATGPEAARPEAPASPGDVPPPVPAPPPMPVVVPASGTPPVETPVPVPVPPLPPAQPEADPPDSRDDGVTDTESLEKNRKVESVSELRGLPTAGPARATATDIVAGGSISAVLSGPAAGGGGLGSGGIGLTSSIGDQRFHRHDRGGRAPGGPGAAALDDFDTEEYAKIDENPFKNAADNPLSTFSIDVDTASYSNVRRFLRDGALPPADAVRLEELVNYFTYEYPDPRGETPFSVTTELATCPWAPKHHLLMVGLQGRRMDTASMPRNNLVFLMDVSGSMNSPDKLPLLKAAFRLLVDSLRPEDRVAIVVYAGAAGVVLPSTPGSEKPRILEAIDRLSAGGSTAGGAGIQLAYQIAKEHLLDGGNNRVILATDGDFNVGTSSTGALTRLIEEKRKDGIFLTVLGFGRHNTKDSRMEALADKGNGNYAYIDSVAEARKVLVTQLGGTLLTIAKDVKIQVEFNPAKVAEYRLIGYENRLLAREDFTNDAKDAGELGAGHTVTALYEIVPLSAVEGASAPTAAPAEPMKYSESMVRDSAKASPELCTVNLRWKKPDGDTSTLETFPVLDRVRAIAESSGDLRWAASVALFGMALRGSELAAGAGLPLAAELARGAVGWDPGGYRTEFMELLKIAQELSRSR